MEPISDSSLPSIATLAYRYGTIKKNELELVNKLYYERPDKSSFDEILINQGFATEYQIGLLKLIQDYLIIQKQGIEFGKIAVEKGLATIEEINLAKQKQKHEFEKVKKIMLLGDVLVKQGIISNEQKDLILIEQNRVEQNRNEKNVSSSLSRVFIAVSDDDMEALALVDKGKNNQKDQ